MGEFTKGDSRFDGTLLGMIGTHLWTGFVTIITLFIGLPWMICAQERWYAKHTYIDGRQMSFIGTGGSLFGSYIKWLILTIITIGIYGFWIAIKMNQWKVKNSVFADSTRDCEPSKFTGGVIGLLGVNLATIFGTILSLGLATPWILCFRERWFSKYTTIEGFQRNFNGTGGALFGNYIKWFLLTIITIGIYSFWIPLKLVKWTVKNTEFENV